MVAVLVTPTSVSVNGSELAFSDMIRDDAEVYAKEMGIPVNRKMSKEKMVAAMQAKAAEQEAAVQAKAAAKSEKKERTPREKTVHTDAALPEGKTLNQCIIDAVCAAENGLSSAEIKALPYGKAGTRALWIPKLLKEGKIARRDGRYVAPTDPQA